MAIIIGQNLMFGLDVVFISSLLLSLTAGWPTVEMIILQKLVKVNSFTQN
ncbi:hypothetical protein MU1_30770 [Paenibacillus glycanilyticus]|uniref:Uncharacterized protein n=1 Tax=Paenibacillus glycanilyticus TaxID=126569 RepID=A0ABQ6GGG3_9BACL|nr:hypothetical protein MU1_30770 [Paenibacillus glycanilyticus]